MRSHAGVLLIVLLTPGFSPAQPSVRDLEQEASSQRAQLHFAEANRVYERALGIQDAEPSGQFRLLLGKGEVSIMLGEAVPAHDALAQAERLAGGDAPSRAAVLRTVALLHSYQEDDSAARQALETALPLAPNNSALRASILAELAAACARLGDHRAARAALEDAARMLAIGASTGAPDRGAITLSLAFASLQAGMNFSAASYLEEARHSAAAAAEPALQELAGTLHAVMEPGAGVSDRLFQRGDPLAQRSGYARLLARGLRAAGSHALDLRRPGPGIRALQCAALLFESAGVWSELGAAYLRMGRTADAVPLLERAASAANAAPEEHARALWIWGLATGRTDVFERVAGAGDEAAGAAAKLAAAAARNAAANSAPLAARARDLARQAGPLAEARLANLLGRARLDARDAAAGEREFRDCEAKLRASGQDRLESLALWNLGEALEMRGKSDEAIAVYLRGISALEEDGEAPPETGLEHSQTTMYQRLVRLLMAAGRKQEAFSIAERALRAQSARPAAEGDDADALDSLLLERDAAEARLGTAPDAGWEKRHANAVRERSALIKRLTAARPGAASSPEAVQAKMPGDLAVLEYFDSGSKVFGFALRHDQFVAFESPLGPADLARLIERGSAGALLDSQRAMRELYAALVAPVRNTVAARLIAFVPSGVLCATPFAALMDGEQYLIDSSAVFVAESAGDSIEPRRTATAGRGLLLLRGADLPAAADAGSGLEVAVESTRAGFAEHGPGSSVVRIAAPAVVEPRVPWASRLIPGDGDSTIEANELAELDFRRTGLVLVENVQNARSGSPLGEEALIFTREFREAGAATVLSSPSPVNADTVGDLEMAFFRQLRAGDTKAAALRAAQLEIRAKHPWPGVWAAFTLTGDPGAMELPRSAAPGRARLTGTVESMEGTTLIVNTSDGSRLRIRCGDATRIQQAGRPASLGAIARGASVTVEAVLNGDGTIAASAVDLAATGTDPPAGEFILAVDDPVLRAATAAAQDATNKLPDFNCRQVTKRLESQDDGLTWNGYPGYTAEVVYVDHHAFYRQITQNEMPWSRGIMELDRFTTSGEYGTVLNNIFLPVLGARFRLSGEERLNGRDALIYEYRIEEANADWELMDGKMTVKPAYHGRIWIDKSDHWPWRIEHVADLGIPAAFAWRRTVSDVSYDMIRIPEVGQFLLPRDASILTCHRNSNECSRNEITFGNYQRFVANSSVRFDTREQPAKRAPGNLIWKGELRPLEILTIEGRKASSGTIEGDWLPGSGVSVTVDPALKVIQPPGEENGWTKLVLQNGSKRVRQIVIRWEIQP